MSRKIDYEYLVQEALRQVVKQCLVDTGKKGLPGNHHFYISFRTDYPGVDIPDYLKEQYPDEITIVMQYEFWDLEINEDGFHITLCFNDIHERICVPFGSIVNFVDPSVKFGLQFSPSIYEESIEEISAPLKKSSKESKGTKNPKISVVETDDGTGANVITLDAFRKK